MDGLKEWAMTIAGIVVLGTACEVILPDDNFRKYVRLAIGLVLILTLASPLTRVLNRDIEVQLPQISHTAYKQREEMEETQREDIMCLYQRNLNAKIENTLAQRLGEIPVKVRCSIETDNPDTFGTIDQVAVLVDASYGKDVSQEIEQSLYQDFGVNKKKVTVRYLKESNE